MTKKCEILVYFVDIREIQHFQQYAKISSNMFYLGCKSLLISNFMKMSVLRQKKYFRTSGIKFSQKHFSFFS